MRSPGFLLINTSCTFLAIALCWQGGAAAAISASPTGGAGSTMPESTGKGPAGAARGEFSAQQGSEMPDASCLARTICQVKERVRWRTPAWSPEFCARVADVVIKSSLRYDISPALILAIMINESDMNEKAVWITAKAGHVYAKDGGLMGLRCVVDKHEQCTNGTVRGLYWNQVMEPLTNIALGARELAYWRDVGGATTETVRRRDGQGNWQTMVRLVRCTHKNHAYWAHYNHGLRYIDHGPARHYPQRVAVLYYSLLRVMNLDTSALAAMKLSVRDPGGRPRTADRPIEARYHKLCQLINETGSTCKGLASTDAHSDHQD
jgi:hypothetical protein